MGSADFHGKPFSTMAVNVLSLCHVRETSPGTHTFFRTYTCPVYCWRSVQLLDFSLSSSLIHASQPIRISCPVGTTFTGQCFASGFLQPPPHDDALSFSCILPTAGRIRDFHPLERAPAGHTSITPDILISGVFFIMLKTTITSSALPSDILCTTSVLRTPPFAPVKNPLE